MPCCAFGGCKHVKTGNKTDCDGQLQLGNGEENNQNDDENEDDEEINAPFSESDLFRLNIIFRRIQHDTNGKIRIRHVFDICSQLGIKYSKTQLPQTVLLNQTELLLTSMRECKRLINVVRVVGELGMFFRLMVLFSNKSTILLWCCLILIIYHHISFWFLNTFLSSFHRNSDRSRCRSVSLRSAQVATRGIQRERDPAVRTPLYTH
jgi:hypothetical protein